MNATTKTYLSDAFKSLSFSGQYYYDDSNIFFADMPRDFLKDNDYAVNCFIVRDRKNKAGKIINRVRNEECTEYTYTRREYSRVIMYRCQLYALHSIDLWGDSVSTGLVDQLEQYVADNKRLADSNNNCITVTPEEAVRPFNNEVKTSRLKRRSDVAFIRIQFSGGIYTTWNVPIIPSIEFEPEFKKGE